MNENDLNIMNSELEKIEKMNGKLLLLLDKMFELQADTNKVLIEAQEISREIIIETTNLKKYLS